MSGSFEKREKGFEAKWAHDEELRFKVYARRNKLLGLWAAGEMGLNGPAADAYAKEVIAADFDPKRFRKGRVGGEPRFRQHDVDARLGCQVEEQQQRLGRAGDDLNMLRVDALHARDFVPQFL